MTREECIAKAEGIAEAVEDIVNGAESDLSRALRERLPRMYRTLQQSSFRVVQEIIRDYAKTEYFDPRNEAAVEWCRAVSELEGGLPLI